MNPDRLGTLACTVAIASTEAVSMAVEPSAGVVYVGRAGLVAQSQTEAVPGSSYPRELTEGRRAEVGFLGWPATAPVLGG
jgi:hypothetical protein